MKNKPDLRSRLRFSIVARLNIRLWLGLLSFFIGLNLLLLAAVTANIIYYAEEKVAAVAPYLEGGIDQTAQDLFALLGIETAELAAPPQGWVLPKPLQGLVSRETAQAARRFQMLSPPEQWDRSWNTAVEQFVYRVEFAQNGRGYALVINLKQPITIGAALLAVVLVSEIIVLISRFFSGAQLIRETLTPLTELAKQAESLNVEQGPLSLEEMKALAGKLDAITAAKLDTRIDLEQTQDELKGLAAAINGMLDRINEAYRSQARFVSDASHELRTPIAAIQGYANLLDRWGKHDPQALQESIDAIKEEAANMKELVEQLLFLARGDNNRMPLQIERIDLADTAQTVVKEARMIDGGHDFVVDVESAFVEGDPGLIKQALRILVDNAIKYTPAGGEIKVAVKQQGDQVRMTVQDNGIGIPPEAVPYIFDRFYRADESRARSTGGTGLGLSIAKWIVERHGGHFEVLSREDVGTRITIVLRGV